MRRTSALLLLALASCTPGVESETALLQAGGAQPADGLWALVPKDCAAPTSASMTSWPECAMPVWLKGGMATAFVGSVPVHMTFVMATGDPRLIQLANPVGDSPPLTGAAPPKEAGAAPQGYLYWAFVPDGDEPYRKGRIWQIACPAQEIAGIAKKTDGKEGCVAGTAEAVRAASRLAPEENAQKSAVWIAPGD